VGVQRRAQDALRRRAEDRLRAQAADEVLPDAQAVQRLGHELSVHEIELEIQNEQLRLTQVELETARDGYRDLYERAPVGYLTAGLDGSVLQANARACDLLGLTAPQLRERLVLDLVVPESKASYLDALRQLFVDAEPRWVELQLRDPKGRAHWFGVEMMLVHDSPDHKPQCRLALIDIDERVMLRRELAQLAAIVSSSSDAIVGRDVSGCVTSWNAAAERLFGFTADEMLGRPLDAVVPPERASEEAELLRRLRRGESITGFETERQCRDGTRVPVSLTLSPVLDDNGRVSGSSLTAANISDRKNAERAQHKRLRQLDLLAQAGHALIMADAAADEVQGRVFDGVRLAVGAELCLHYRFEPGSEQLTLKAALGDTQGLAENVAAPALGESLCGLVVQRGVPVVVDALQSSVLPQATRLKASGMCCYAGFPLMVRGTPRGVAAFASTSRAAFRDGDLHLIQTVCDQVSATLERASLVDELRERELRLQDADRAKDEFIATLAHELRNPLAPIRNAVHVMSSGPPDDARLAWCREVIERQVAQMARLLEDLLDVGGISHKKLQLRRARLDLRQAVEQAVETSRPLIDGQRHQLQLDLTDEPATVYGDLTRLTQVFANLLSNAAKYTDPGGRIELSLSTADGQACVVVRDNGIGIDASQLPRVFDMFSQLTPALERSRGGLGIGLSLARSLVELHGGRVELRSEGAGQGTEVVVCLPLLDVLPTIRPVAAAEAPVPAPAAPYRRVLVVDDNADGAESLALLLGVAGCEARTARSGAEALAVGEQWQPDAAVIDIGMPEMNGYELCRRLRNCPWGEHMLLVACTGWGMEDDRRRASAAGFDHHMVKPVDTDALVDLVTHAPRPS
jgi:PAS domain S-box-containing protein